MEQGNIGGISELNEEQKDRLGYILANNEEMEKFSDLLAVSMFTKKDIKERYTDGKLEIINGSTEVSRYGYCYNELKQRLQQIGLSGILAGKFKLNETKTQSIAGGVIGAILEPINIAIPIVGLALADIASETTKSVLEEKRQERLKSRSKAVDEIQELVGLPSDLFYEAFALYLTKSLKDQLSSFTPHKGGLARKSTTTKVNDLISEEISRIKKFLAGNDVRTLFKKGERVDGVEVIRRIVERVAHLGEENKKSLRYKAGERFKEKTRDRKKGQGKFIPKKVEVKEVSETGLELRKLLMEKKEKTRVERFLLDQQGKVIKAFVLSETQKGLKASERKVEELKRRQEELKKEAKELKRKAAEDNKKIEAALKEERKKREVEVGETKTLIKVASDFRELLEEALNATLLSKSTTSKGLETGKKEKEESKSLASEKFNVVIKTENGKRVFEITHPDPKKLEEFADGFNEWSKSKNLHIETVKPNGRQAIVIKVQDKSLLQKIINFILSLLGKEIKEKKKIVMQLKLEEKVEVLSAVKERATEQQAQQDVDGKSVDDKSKGVKLDKDGNPSHHEQTFKKIIRKYDERQGGLATKEDERSEKTLYEGIKQTKGDNE